MEAEAFPIRFTKGIRSYWRRHNYKHVDGSSGAAAGRGTQRHQLVRLGGGAGSDGGDGPRPWAVRLGRMARRVRAPPAPAVAAAKAPGRVLGKIRDAYVDAMLGAAKTQPVAAKTRPNAAEALWQKRVPVRRSLSRSQARQQPEELGQRLVDEMYKSVVASRSISPSRECSVHQ